LKFIIPSVRNKPLFKGDLLPDDTRVFFEKCAALNMLRGSKAEREKFERVQNERNRLFLNKKTRVSIGMPYFENLLSRLKSENEEIPYEIRRLAVDSDFHFVSFNCSFIPHEDCRVYWARFAVRLTATDELGEHLYYVPRVYEMFPDHVVEKAAYEKKADFSADFKFNLGLIKANIQGGKRTERKGLISYQPLIYAWGIGTDVAGWDFKSEGEQGIWGNKRNLLLIIRTPKGSHVWGTCDIFAKTRIKKSDLSLGLSAQQEEALFVEQCFPLTEDASKSKYKPKHIRHDF
jgi:hypothetical protein